MYFMPTEESIQGLNACFSVHLEEIPRLLPESDNTSLTHEIISRMKNRPVLARRLFKCKVHNMANRTLVIMRLIPYTSITFSGKMEQELYLQLAIKNITINAKNRGFDRIRISGPLRALEDVLLDNGFNRIKYQPIPETTSMIYMGLKNLKKEKYQIK